MYGKTTKPVFLYTQHGIASFIKFKALKKKKVQNSIEEDRGSTTQGRIFFSNTVKTRIYHTKKLIYSRTLEFPFSAKRGENTAKPALS
ncbi:hypothetical protein L873DRAFT_1811544 [Choiromyces venosus 120613-1]|uniref:Uncharacterized protein n=1 Tax=Choiromyces venosus 120613-1 TaxID=1336337 RepID=A0A3N4JIZ3_9PEZI|nr:hypothetical protein L873DRAFT_1811544 [Choiromyces venosus 120613-1]